MIDMIDKKNKVKKILTTLRKTVYRPLDVKGNLDVEAYNKLEGTKQAISKLKKLGVDCPWLANNYFFTASIILYI